MASERWKGKKRMSFFFFSYFIRSLMTKIEKEDDLNYFSFYKL